MSVNISNINLDESYKEVEKKYSKQNPKSKILFQNAIDVMPGGNTRTVLHYAPFPLTFSKGQGAKLETVDGKILIDFLGEYTAGIYGHNNKKIQNAIENAVRNGIVLGGPNLMESKLARVLVERFPALDLVRFTNSGTEANLMAICAARAYSGRSKVIAMKGGYHGGVLSFASSSPVNAPFDVKLVSYNNTQKIKETILKEKNQIACVILEPMMGSSGCIPASIEFLKTIRELTEENGIILIFDEVMTSRLSPGGLHGSLGIIPDLITLGKYIGGGVSFGAFGGKSDIMKGFDPREDNAWPHAGTFNNNIITMSAGFTGISEIFTAEKCIRLNRKGDLFRERLNQIIKRKKLPMQVSGIGSMNNIHFQSGKIIHPSISSIQKRKLDLMHLDMIIAGVYLARRGMMNLSIPMQNKDFEFIEKVFEEFLDSRQSEILQN